MPEIVYIDATGSTHRVEVPVGRTVMDGAFKNDLPGILADCGGSCSCGTCRVQVAPEWQAGVGPASDMEEAILDLDADAPAGIRLSCQITVSAEMDGLTVHLPQDQ